LLSRLKRCRSISEITHASPTTVDQSFASVPGRCPTPLNSMTIETARLRLQLRSREELLALFEGMAEVSPAWLARIRDSTAPDPWTYGFGVFERSTGADVGHAAFKGPPDAAGMVEIAYGIFPDFQGRGFATEAAEGLTAFALGPGRVRFVWAHTKPDNIASVRVLEKNGFRRIGEVVDPDDGLVLRWERVNSIGTNAAARERVLRQAYAAFNARDIPGVLALMRPDVHWANGMEGGYVDGHEAVREYWTRQWALIDPRVRPLTFRHEDDGRVVVDVRQIVLDPAGVVVVDGIVQHAYRFADGLICEMEILAAP
jgi:RimJ/RimL family protein N-acetyltransferase/ketosteroid isomerase-like protein